MKRILIVDDDSDLLKLYRQAFLNAAFVVDASQTLKEAEELVEQNKYDVILLDLLFPNNNSLSVIRQIRRKSSLNSETPVIALTNLESGDITQKAIEYGANECLFKATQTPRTIFETALKFAKNNSSGNNNSTSRYT